MVARRSCTACRAAPSSYARADSRPGLFQKQQPDRAQRKSRQRLSNALQYETLALIECALTSFAKDRELFKDGKRANKVKKAASASASEQETTDSEAKPERRPQQGYSTERRSAAVKEGRTKLTHEQMSAAAHAAQKTKGPVGRSAASTKSAAAKREKRVAQGGGTSKIVQNRIEREAKQIAEAKTPAELAKVNKPHRPWHESRHRLQGKESKAEEKRSNPQAMSEARHGSACGSTRVIRQHALPTPPSLRVPLHSPLWRRALL